MTAKELLDAGDLSSAISQVGEDLKKDPTDQVRRTFLFELLCCAGDLDRAGKQLDMISAANADAAITLRSYRNLLVGEKNRRLLFTAGREPAFAKRVPEYTRFHLDAIHAVREGRHEDSRALLEEAEAMRPPVRGAINSEPFEDFKDADDLLGPFLEIITSDNYAWLPWETVRSVALLPPVNLRDLVWIPARVELDIGPLAEAYIPVLYAGSYLNSDNQVKLGRITDWKQNPAGLALGDGQRMLVADDRDWPLLDVRTLEIEAVDGEDGNSGPVN